MQTIPIDPDRNYTVTLQGDDWMIITSSLMALGIDAMIDGLDDAAQRLVEVGTAVVKQIDPAGWAALNGGRERR